MNLLFWKKPEPSKPEHVHSWPPIAVYQGTTAGIHGKPVTEILCRCECGEYDTKFAWGHWYLEQVSSGGIVEELKRMASL